MELPIVYRLKNSPVVLRNWVADSKMWSNDPRLFELQDEIDCGDPNCCLISQKTDFTMSSLSQT